MQANDGVLLIPRSTQCPVLSRRYHAACLYLTLKASVHAVDDYGSICLHHASANGHAACVRALVAAGADVNHEDEFGNTPFSVALFHDHRRVLKELLRAGARVHFLGHKASGTDSWKLVDAVRKVPGGWANYAARRASDVERATTPPTLPDEIRRLIVAFVEPPGGY